MEAIFVAHEIGHSLGVRHVKRYCTCSLGMYLIGRSDCDGCDDYFKLVSSDSECLRNISTASAVQEQSGNKLVEKGKEYD